MTAIVAIMNKQSVAIAADTAMTATNGCGFTKVFHNHKKIFPLSCKQPIAIATYGCAEFMGVPIDSLIKAYNCHIKNDNFRTVADCRKKFLSFLMAQKQIMSETVQKETLKTELRRLYMDLAAKEENAEKLLSSCYVSGKAQGLVHLRYRTFLKDVCLPLDDIEKELNLSLQDKVKFRELAFEYFTSCISFDEVGLVFVGFGQIEPYPSSSECNLYGVFHNKLKYQNMPSKSISDKYPSEILSFAQDDMIYSITRGVSLNVWMNLNSAVNECTTRLSKEIEKLKRDDDIDVTLLIENITREFRDQISDIINLNFNNALCAIEASSILDIAVIARTLISITNFQMHLSFEEESVNDQIDVLSITKYDGCRWI